MNFGRIKLRTALIIPFSIFVVVLIGLIVFVWKRDYDWLAKQQGAKIATVLNESTSKRIDEFLADPLRINALFAKQLSEAVGGDFSDLSEVEALSYQYLKTAVQDTPNISVVSFGDERGRFVGHRINEDGSVSLMLQDVRTKGQLNIYGGSTKDTKVLGRYEGYDPRLRPWYAPVKMNPVRQWSEIYINADEQMQATISTLMPVHNKEGKFIGVADIDIKLNGISEFLKETSGKGSGAIYIIDKKWNVIASSENEKSTKLIKDAAGNLSVEMTKAYDYDNAIIRTSARFLEANQGLKEDVFTFQINQSKVFAQIKHIGASGNLGWQIITVIPEQDLLGTMRQHQQISLWIVLILGMVVMGLGILIIAQITKPIKMSSERATALASGDFGLIGLEHGHFILEIDELTKAFNHMAETLKESFEAIQTSEYNYRTLVENTEDMIYNLSPTGTFLSINSKFERELGVERQQILGKSIEVLFQEPKDRLFWHEQFYKVVSSQEKLIFTYDYRFKNGDRRIFNVSLMPQKDRHGRVVSILGTNTDITKLVKAHEEIEMLHGKEKAVLEQRVEERTNELKAAMHELIEKEKLASLGGLVSGIAHEINTPLGVSVSAASYLKTINEQMVAEVANGQLKKSQLIEYFHNLDETAKILNTNLYRASELVKSFKEISIGQVTEDLSIFNLKEYLEMILLSLKHEYKRTGHQIEILCDENLSINSYSGVFAQIFTNLIMNALIHGLSGKESGHIRIEVTYKGVEKPKKGIVTSGGELHIHFSDDGVGISKAHIGHIFEPFFTTNRKEGGSGLGLSVVYNLITGKLGGKISCESTVNEGTHFYMTIPNR